MLIMPARSTAWTPGRAAPPVSPRKSANKQSTPLPAAITIPAPTFSSDASKSPIKKHLKNAAAMQWPLQSASPTKTSTHHTSTRSSAPMVALRASIIQVMLGLLDQDEATVEGTIPILQTLAALPLTDPATRRKCLRMLTTLEQQQCVPPAKASPSRVAPLDQHYDAASDVPTSEGDNDKWSECSDSCGSSGVLLLQSHARSLSSFSSSSKSTATTTHSSSGTKAGERIREATRTSGRAKSLSLSRCKAFLLACANEIHELDSENPNFDYAEETSSELSHDVHGREARTTAAAGHGVTARSLLTRTHSRKGWRTSELDYASIVTNLSCASVATELDQDDVNADQGSEFSEVLRRADYLSDVSDADASSDDDDEISDDVSSNNSDSSDDSDDDASSESSWVAEHPAEQQRTALIELDHVRSRVLCRHALYQLRAAAASASTAQRSCTTTTTMATTRQLQHQVFAALKQHRDTSWRQLQLQAFAALQQHCAERTHQRRVFDSMKIHVEQMQCQRAAMQSLRIATTQRRSVKRSTSTTSDAAANATSPTAAAAAALRAKVLVAQHLDVVFVTLCAAFTHAVTGS